MFVPIYAKLGANDMTRGCGVCVCVCVSQQQIIKHREIWKLFLMVERKGSLTKYTLDFNSQTQKNEEFQETPSPPRFTQQVFDSATLTLTIKSLGGGRSGRRTRKRRSSQHGHQDRCGGTGDTGQRRELEGLSHLPRTDTSNGATSEAKATVRSAS